MYTLIKLAFKVSDMANKASSDYLMSLCHSAYFHYVDDLVLVYAIVKADTDTSVLADLPTVEFDNKHMNENLKYANKEKIFMGEL